MGDPRDEAPECYASFGPLTRYFIRRAYRGGKYTRKALSGGNGLAPSLGRARTVIRMGIERTSTWMGAPGVIVFSYCIPVFIFHRSGTVVVIGSLGLVYVLAWQIWEAARLKKAEDYFRRWIE